MHKTLCLALLLAASKPPISDNGKNVPMPNRPQRTVPSPTCNNVQRQATPPRNSNWALSITKVKTSHRTTHKLLHGG